MNMESLVADVELTPDESQFVRHLINNFAAEIQDEPPFDPQGKRMRGDFS